jgi:transcriptional regulator with XRE-family HTH domain
MTLRLSMEATITPLRKVRKQARITLQEVAAAVGWDTGNLSRVERGQRCSYEMAERLVAFFGADKITIRDILAAPRARSPRSRSRQEAIAL